MNMRSALMGLSLAWMLSACAVYNTTSKHGTSDLMLGGYDPVSYFDEGQPRPGKPGLRKTHRYGTYFFASPKNLQKFSASPDRFVPQYGGFCSKGVSYAIRAGGNPRVFEIRENRLFIFVNDYARDYWRLDPPDFIAKADGYWESELKDAPVKWTNLKRFVFRVPHYKTYPQEFADYERRSGKKAPVR